jgi:hypothetical protein
VLAQRGGGAEAGVRGDALDRQVRGLQQASGALDPLHAEPGVRALPGLRAEAAGEGAHTHRRVRGQALQRQRLVQAVQGEGAGGGGAGFRCLRDDGRGLAELRLAAVPPWGHDVAPRHPVRHLDAVVAPHDVQQQVDPGGVAGGGEHVAVVDVEHVRVEADLREERSERLGAHPVGGRGPAVEQTRGREHVRARADGHQPGVRAPCGEGRGHRRVEPALDGRRTAQDPGDDDGPGRREDRRVVVGQHRVVRRGADRAAVDRAGPHAVERAALAVERAAQEAVRQPQLEGDDVREREHRDLVPGRAARHAGRLAHGRILAHVGFRATGRCGGRLRGWSV